MLACSIVGGVTLAKLKALAAVMAVARVCLMPAGAARAARPVLVRLRGVRGAEQMMTVELGSGSGPAATKATLVLVLSVAGVWVLVVIMACAGVRAVA